MIASAFKDLDKYQRLAAAAGERHRVFVGSMMDIFEKPMPLVDNNGDKVILGAIKEAATGHLRTMLFENITNGWYPNLIFLFLTKRPSNINKFIPTSWKTNPPSNIMFGTSPVDQPTADKLVSQLLEVSGYKFLSVEPQLAELSLSSFGKVEMNRGLIDTSFPIHWVINGGESGHGKRPFNTDWDRKLKAECEAFSVPFFMKQVDKIQPIPEDLMVREFPDLG